MHYSINVRDYSYPVSLTYFKMYVHVYIVQIVNIFCSIVLFLVAEDHMLDM